MREGQNVNKRYTHYSDYVLQLPSCNLHNNTNYYYEHCLCHLLYTGDPVPQMEHLSFVHNISSLLSACSNSLSCDYLTVTMWPVIELQCIVINWNEDILINWNEGILINWNEGIRPA